MKKGNLRSSYGHKLIHCCRIKEHELEQNKRTKRWREPRVVKAHALKSITHHTNRNHWLWRYVWLLRHRHNIPGRVKEKETMRKLYILWYIAMALARRILYMKNSLNSQILDMVSAWEIAGVLAMQNVVEIIRIFEKIY